MLSALEPAKTSTKGCAMSKEFDGFLEFIARQDTLFKQIADDVVKRVAAQPGFVAHKEEVLNEFAESPKTDNEGILGQMTRFVDAYKRVMRRHGLPEDPPA
jgi:hypothetical protein